MNLAATRPDSILRPFAVLAALAFTVGFLGVMAVSGMSTLGQLGAFSPSHARAVDTASTQAAEPIASPAAASGAAADNWNFPKRI